MLWTCRCLYDAQPLFSNFLAEVVAGKQAPVKLPAKPEPQVVPFFAAPEDEFEPVDTILPSKRRAKGASKPAAKKGRGRAS